MQNPKNKINTAIFTMDITAVSFLPLDQQDCSLKDHTRDFLNLACLTHYPDHSLYVFYHSGLNERWNAHLPVDGP